MPLLRSTEPLPGLPSRVVVAGTSGSGKTTLAARIAAVLDVPHVEIDGLFHGPRWTPRPGFRRDVEAFTRATSWVTEWQYDEVRDLLTDRAHVLVWLDLPRSTVMQQVVRRTVRRRLRRQRLWHGNLEPPFRTILTDDEHIVRWAWTTYDTSRQRVLDLRERRPALAVVHLTSHAEADAWLAGALGDALASASAGRRRGGHVG